MADIEFQRRGTPLWLVLLVLLVLGGGGYFLFAGRGEDPAAVAADSAAAAATPSTTSAAPAAAPAPLPPPAGASGPAAEFVRFAEGNAFPAGDAGAQRTYMADLAKHFANVVQQQSPGHAEQVVLLLAVSDTLRMPDLKAERVSDLTQLTFYAFAHGMPKGPMSDKLATFAAQVQPNVPLREQAGRVREYVRTAHDLVKNPQTAIDRKDSMPPNPPKNPPAGASGATGAPAGGPARP